MVVHLNVPGSGVAHGAELSYAVGDVRAVVPPRKADWSGLQK